MKNNKAFTLIELLVVLGIIVIVGLLLTSMVAVIANIFNLLVCLFVYFSVPAIIVGVFLKLNQKYKWIIKPNNSSRYMINNQYVDASTVHTGTVLFFLFWAIYIPVAILYIILNEVYNRYLKNWFKIPTE